VNDEGMTSQSHTHTHCRYTNTNKIFIRQLKLWMSIRISFLNTVITIC